LAFVDWWIDSLWRSSDVVDSQMVVKLSAADDQCGDEAVFGCGIEYQMALGMVSNAKMNR